MPNYAQLVVGPAGSGKSTYISAMLAHAQAINRSMVAVNLDPAAEVFNYNPFADIRELIQTEDVMEDQELNFGPNGALVYAMEYFMQNLDWFTEKIQQDRMDDDYYFLFDTPGQIELVSHFPLMKKFVKYLEEQNFRVCVVFLLDSQFISDMSKYFGSLIISLITLINLELPMVNLLSKVDKLPPHERKALDDILEPSAHLLNEELPCFQRNQNEKFYRLSRAFAEIIDDYSLHRFMPLSVMDEDLMNDVLLAIDSSIQYGEDQDVQTRDFDI